MAHAYSPSTEHITLLCCLPVIFYLASISMYSRFNAFKLCLLPSKEDTQTTFQSVAEAKRYLMRIAIRFGVSIVVFVLLVVGLLKIAGVVFWVFAGYIVFTLADVNRAFVSYFLGLESVTMAKTSKGTLVLESIHGRTYLFAFVVSSAFVAFCATFSPPYLSSLLFLPMSISRASYQHVKPISLRWMFSMPLLFGSLFLAFLVWDTAKKCAVNSGSEPLASNYLLVEWAASLGISYFSCGLVGNLVTMLYRMDRQFAEKKAGFIQLGCEVAGLERLPPLEGEDEGERVVLLPLRQVLLHELRSSSIEDFLRFGFAKLAAGIFIISMAALPFLFAWLASDSKNDRKRHYEVMEVNARIACVLLAPLLLSVAVSVAAWWRGEFGDVWNYSEMWKEEVEAVDSESGEKLGSMAEKGWASA